MNTLNDGIIDSVWYENAEANRYDPDIFRVRVIPTNPSMFDKIWDANNVLYEIANESQEGKRIDFYIQPDSNSFILTSSTFLYKTRPDKIGWFSLDYDSVIKSYSKFISIKIILDSNEKFYFVSDSTYPVSKSPL